MNRFAFQVRVICIGHNLIGLKEDEHPPLSIKSIFSLAEMKSYNLRQILLLNKIGNIT